MHGVQCQQVPLPEHPPQQQSQSAKHASQLEYGHRARAGVATSIEREKLAANVKSNTTSARAANFLFIFHLLP